MGAYPASVLVSLEREVKHLARLVALLVHQLIADGQHPWEADLDNLVEMHPILALHSLVPEGAADGEQALEAGQDRARVIRVEKLGGEVHEARPSTGKVGL